MKITIDINNQLDILEIKQFLNDKGVIYNEEKELQVLDEPSVNKAVYDNFVNSKYNNKITELVEEEIPIDCFIHPTAIIYSNVKIGANVYIGAYCVIGGPPEHREYWNGEYWGVVLGDNVRISNHVTIDAGTERDTIIGSGSIILAHAHVGHDAIIEEGVTVSCGAKIGGECRIGEYTNIGLNASIHQRVAVPSGCMIGANAFVGKTTEMEPNSKYVGVPAKYLGPNIKRI